MIHEVMPDEPFRSIADDPLQRVFRHIRLIVAALLLYGTTAQVIGGNRNGFFIAISVGYFLWNLLTGFYLARYKPSERYDSASRQYVRFITNSIVCLLLLRLGHGANEYYWLLYPSLIVFVRNSLSRPHGKRISMIASLTLSLFHFLAEASIRSNGFVALSSILFRSFVLAAAGFISYWFWRNRQSHDYYVHALRNMHEVSHRLTGVEDFHQALQLLAASALKTMHADIVAILPYDDHKGTFSKRKVVEGELLRAFTPFGSGTYELAQQLVSNQQNLFIDDIGSDSGRSGFSDPNSFAARERVVSVAALILQAENKPIGVLFINYRSPHSFTSAEVSILEMYATSAALTIRRVREKEAILERVRFSTTRIADIQRLVDEPVADSDRAVLRLILDESMRLLDETLGYFALYDAEAETLTLTISSDAYGSQLGRSWPADFGLTGKALTTHATQVMHGPDPNSSWQSFATQEVREYETTIDEKVCAAIALPLAVSNKSFGVLMIESFDQNSLTTLDASILESLVIAASIALTNTRLIAALAGAGRFLQNLRDIDTKILESEFDLKKTLNLILSSALTTVGGAQGNVLLTTRENELRVMASTTLESEGTLLNVTDSISGIPILENRTVYIRDLKEEDKYGAKYQALLGPNIRCELLVRLILKGIVIGVINVESTEPDAFTPDQIEALETLAGQTAIVIHIAQLVEDLKKRRQELDALRAIDRAILDSKLNLPETLNVILSHGLSLIGQKHGEILLIGPRADTLRVERSTAPHDEGSLLEGQSSICGLVLKHHKAIYVPQFGEEPECEWASMDERLYLPNLREQLLYHEPPWGRMSSELAVPLEANGEIIGVLNIESIDPFAFDFDSVRLLRNLSGAAAIAILNARRFQELETAQNRLLEFDPMILGSLSNFLSNKFHAIANPVTNMKSDARQILKEESGLSELSMGRLNNIIKYSDNVFTLADKSGSFLDGFVTSKMSNLNLQDAIDEAVREVQKPDDIVIESNIQQCLPLIRGNIDSLKDMVLEFLHNAFDAIEGRGRILITLTADGSVVKMVIEDDGRGMDETTLSQIFNPGFTTKDDHSGKGLFDNYFRFKVHRASFRVVSQLGKGTTFEVCFPCKQ